jgi:CelD/BcsL family acetyltransferase involved in cellulose biosynthesis/glycosyltransferase involved in cell wall biosynthesis
MHTLADLAPTARLQSFVDASCAAAGVEQPRVNARAATGAGRGTLLLLAKARPDDLVERIAAGEEPVTEYLELAARLNAELVDFGDVDRSRHPLVRTLARRLGLRWGLAAIGALSHRRFADIYATGEDVGIPLAIMLRAMRVHGKLTMVVHNADTPRRRALLRALGDRVFRQLICLSSSQVDVLTGGAGFSGAKVRRLSNWLDHRFFRPAVQGGGDFVLSVGMEGRDYQLLQAASAALPYRFHVIASGWSPRADFAPATGIAQRGNIVVERGVSPGRLRELYANARFVVVPLKPLPYAAGVTSILETMAMRKALVATDSPGVRDYIRPGVSARVVACGDAVALGSAIDELWHDPEAVERMASHNRAWIETELNTDRYVEQVARLLARPVDSPLSVDVITTPEALEAVADEWRGLFARVPTALPFVSHEWATAWWAHLRRDTPFVTDSLNALVVRTRDGTPIGFAPYMRTEYRALGVPLVRILQPIGADPYLTEIRGMLVSPENEMRVLQALTRHADSQSGLDRVRWAGLRRGGEAFAELAARRAAIVDWELSVFPLALDGTWEEFRSSRPRNLREALRKCYNSLARDGHEWRFRVLESTSDVLGSLERFFELHASRAASDARVAHPDYFAAPDARRFLTDVMERFARRRVARVFQIEVAGRVVAMRLGFRFGDSLYLYYSGYDPAWSRYSIMTTVVAEAIRHAIATGARTVNLSSGTDVSKLRWRPDELAYADVVVPARGLRARLAHRSFSLASGWAARRRHVAASRAEPDDGGTGAAASAGSAQRVGVGGLAALVPNDGTRGRSAV